MFYSICVVTFFYIPDLLLFVLKTDARDTKIDALWGHLQEFRLNYLQFRVKLD